MGRSPRLIPLLITHDITATPDSDDETSRVMVLIERLHFDVAEVQNNLLAAKITQAEFANQHHSDEDTFEVRDKVMLSTKHHCCEYIQAKSGHVTKFMPHSDGPFLVTNVNPTKSSYTLDLPNKPN